MGDIFTQIQQEAYKNQDLTTDIELATALANKLGINDAAAKVQYQLTRGTYLTGTGAVNYDGSAVATWNVDATTSNTAGKIVARDSNGGIYASFYDGVKSRLNNMVSNLGSPTTEEMVLFEGQYSNKVKFTLPTLTEESTDGTNYIASTRLSTNQLGDIFIGGGQNTLYELIPASSTLYYRMTWQAPTTFFPSNLTYVFFNAFYAYMSTNSNTVTVGIEAQRPDTNEWISIASGTVNGWPIHAFMRHDKITCHINETSFATQRYKAVRLTFSATTTTYNVQLGSIEWFGGYPAGRRSVEYYDRDKNTYFPNIVIGTKFNSTTVTSAPFSVASTIVVPNLNSDMLDGKHASEFANSTHTHTIADITNLQTTLDAKAGTAVATTSVNGLMSSTDKTKLDGVAANANNYVHPTTDGSLHVPATSTTNNGKVLKAGATAGSIAWGTLTAADVGAAATSHTHAIADVTNLQTTLDAKQVTLVSGTNIKTVNGNSILGTGNIVISSPTKTSDLTNDSGFITSSYVNTAISNIVDSAPGTLDTLNELAAALGDDPNFATTITTSLSNKLDSSTYTANDILTKLKTVDGTGSLLDADLLDGNHASAFALSSHTHAITDVTGLQTALDSKAGTAVATTSVNGLMSSTDKTKLDGIATNANNYVHPTTDGSLHVPATSTTNNGKALVAGATAGSFSWTALAISHVTGLQTALDSKQATLVSGTNIKTINGNSILGSGDLVISSNVAISQDETNSSNLPVVFSTTQTGNLAARSAINKLFFNPSTGLLNNTKIFTKNLSTILLGDEQTGEQLTTGALCIAIGSGSLRYNTNSNANIAIGVSALRGNSSTGLTGGYNTALGSEAGNILTTGSYNLFLGASSGNNLSNGNFNIIIGSNNGASINNSNNNIILSDGEGNIRIKIDGTGQTTVNGILLATTPTIGDISNKVATTAFVDTYVATNKQDTLVSGTNIKTINGNSILGSGNITVATSAGGNDTQIQYNSSGSLVGATHATIESNDLVLKESTSPTIPTSGVKLFSKKYGSTREMMAAMGPSGMDYALQPAIWRQKIGHWNPPGNATTVPGVYGFTPFTVVGTATARSVATTNLLTRQRRLGYVSASTTGSLTSLRQASAQYALGNGTGLGGFYIEIAFAFTDAAAVSGARAFIGLSSSTVAATNVDPSTLTNVIGLAQLSTDNTQLYIVHGGSVAQTDIALGTGFPPMLGTGATNGAPYRFSLWSPPSANGQVYYQLERLDNGTKTNGQIPGTAGTAYPNITTLLTLQAWRTNNATALAVAMDIVSVYTETDY